MNKRGKSLFYIFIFYVKILNVDIGKLKEKIINRFERLSRKQKAYLGAFGVFVAIILWASISVTVMTQNFTRSQIQTNQNKQEAMLQGIILTETKEQKKYWEIYGENGNYDNQDGVALLNNVVGNFYDVNN